MLASSTFKQALILLIGLAPNLVPGAWAQEFESNPQGQQYQAPAGDSCNPPPAGEPPIEAVPAVQPNYGQPGYAQPSYAQPPQPEYNSSGRMIPQYSSQPQYEPPPFVNPRPVTQRYYRTVGGVSLNGYGQPVGPAAQQGYSGSAPQQGYSGPGAAGWYPGQPRFATAPAGYDLPCTLNTAIATNVAKAGNFVQATVQKNMWLQGGAYIPAGSLIDGVVSQATGGRFFSRSGSLSLEFNQLKFPDGTVVNISAHTVGDLANYADKGSGDTDQYRGEGLGTKLGQFALRTAIGAGGGMALGGVLGGMMGHSSWSEMLAGGGLGSAAGALDDVTLRKGRNVMLPGGTQMTIQLDQPLQVPIPINGFGQRSAM